MKIKPHMKKAVIFCLLATVASLSLTSCGVMFGGSKFRGSVIVKNHPNASIYVNGDSVGRGASVGLYPRNRPLVVEVREKGCEPKTQTFPHSFRTGNFILSVITWGLVGLAVDLGTGAAFKPDHVNHVEVRRVSEKDYTFTIEYDGCPTAQ
jgi:hypothetical protein